MSNNALMNRAAKLRAARGARRCRRCGVDKPRSAYVDSVRVCQECVDIAPVRVHKRTGITKCMRCSKRRPTSDYARGTRTCPDCVDNPNHQHCSACHRRKPDRDFEGRKVCRPCRDRYALPKSCRDAIRPTATRDAATSPDSQVRRIRHDMFSSKLDGGKWRAGKPRPGDAEGGMPVSVSACHVWFWSRGREVPDAVLDAWWR